MARRAPRRLRRRSAGPKIALLSFLVLAIVAAPVTGNRVALVHAHGAEHPHVHVLPPALGTDLASDPESLAAWHGRQHDHDHDRDYDHDYDHAPGHGADSRPAEDDHAPPPAGSYVKLDAPAMAAPDHGAPERKGPPTGAAPTIDSSLVLMRDHVPRRPLPYEERPPPRATCGGIVALLRSSHALLN